LGLFKRKFKGGLISGLELSQAAVAYEQIAQNIPPLERQIALLEDSLSVLLGRNPGAINRGKTFEALVMPKIPQGLPSDLLLRRPDIRQSEQNLIAANARVGVARTQYFPTISLTGLFGYSSDVLSDLLFENSANFWQMAGRAIGPIFTGGRITGEVRQAEAVQQELLNAYLGTILTAFKEVNDSLISLKRLREELEIQERHIKALKDNVKFASQRYDEKLCTYLEVIDAEKRLFTEEFDHAQTQNDLFESMVNIYKTMGGGWVMEADRLITQPSQKVEATSHTQ
jgi:multidrug efflux system outer membrane protein